MKAISSKKHQNKTLRWFLIIIFYYLVGYSIILYFTDKADYQKGYQAYEQADCIGATRHFDKIIGKWRLFDFGGYANQAQKEKAECIPFQTAVDKQNSGDFQGAFTAFVNFVQNQSSVLASAAIDRSSSLFGQAKPSDLASLDACQNINFILQSNIIPQPADNLPPFYLACGRIYDKAGNVKSSYPFYVALITEYPDDPLAVEAESSLVENPVACEQADSLKKNITITERTNFLPRLYLSCGRRYDEANDLESSYAFYEALLTDYPSHELAVNAESSMLANHLACHRIDSFLANSVVSSRADFMPKLYFNCGQQYEKDSDWSNAIQMYEFFLANFPDHSLSPDVEAALAKSIVAQTKSTNAGEIPPPSVRGTTGNDLTEVVIQNDSPERLRIVFSGAKSLVQELGACDSCKTYSLVGPQYCPELGPIGRYALPAGEYDVVVETISGEKVTPWIGSWSLNSGDKYYNCFFVITTGLP